MQKLKKFIFLEGFLAKNRGKMGIFKVNRFFVFRPPFFAEKRKIEKKRKTKNPFFGATHRYGYLQLSNSSSELSQDEDKNRVDYYMNAGLITICIPWLPGLFYTK